MISIGLRIAGFVLFVIATFNTPYAQKLTTAGLACWVLSTLVPIGHL